MAFAAVAAPDTPADFIVPEEWSATEQLQRSAAESGLGFMVWTLNDEAGMREQLRRSADGIITDHPDRVLALRAEMQQETGLADVLVDAVTRFVKVV
jgi:glycerophosphoryl diester phosphodiesterase